MRILTGPRGLVPCMLLLVSGLFSATTSFARVVEVVGYAESEIQNPHSFSGLRVTIECKVNKGHFVTRGSGKIDDKGKFNMNIPHEIVSNDGVLMEECYAQLHSAAGTPCPAHDGLESNKIVFLSKTGDRHIMGLKQNLRFTPQLCVSKFFWPMPPFKGFDHHFPLPPPLELPPFPKPCPPKQSPPSVPVYDPPPPVPVHEPPPKVELPPPVPKKPCPPPKVPVPVQKPPPIHKKPCPPNPPKIDIPPPVPVHKPPPKKPCPPKPPKKVDPTPVPVHKPPPKIEHPPIYKPPVVIPKKLCPPPVPIYIPPVVIVPKKPCPPLPKFPPLPPKYINHPKFGKWPPQP